MLSFLWPSTGCGKLDSADNWCTSVEVLRMLNLVFGLCSLELCWLIFEIWSTPLLLGRCQSLLDIWVSGSSWKFSFWGEKSKPWRTSHTHVTAMDVDYWLHCRNTCLTSYWQLPRCLYKLLARKGLYLAVFLSLNCPRFNSPETFWTHNRRLLGQTTIFLYEFPISHLHLLPWGHSKMVPSNATLIPTSLLPSIEWF